MKKFVAALLVFAMILTLSATAMAATQYAEGDWVMLKRDATAYSAAKSGKATNSVAEKGSVAQVVKQSGDFVKVKVAMSKASTKTTYFRKSDLKRYTGKDEPFILIFWVKDGTGMSKSLDWIEDYYPQMTKVKVTRQTDLRKTNGLEHRSRGVVEKGEVLEYLGKMGYDDRGVGWYKVRKDGKVLWISVHCATTPYGKKQ